MKPREYSRARARLQWLANCNSQKELEEFRAKHRNYNWPNEVTLEIRDRLRKLWRGQFVDHLATQILFTEPFEYAIDIEKKLRDGKMHILRSGGKRMIAGPPAVVKHGKLVPNSQNQFQEDLWALLNYLHKAKVCMRGRKCDSGAPYYIEKPREKNTKFCSRECKQAVREESFMDYYERIGRKRRQERMARKRKAG